MEGQASKFKENSIKIQVNGNATPTIQPPRHIPLQKVEQLEKIYYVLKEDIIKGPPELEEHEIYKNNLVYDKNKLE